LYKLDFLFIKSRWLYSNFSR